MRKPGKAKKGRGTGDTRPDVNLSQQKPVFCLTFNVQSQKIFPNIPLIFSFPSSIILFCFFLSPPAFPYFILCDLVTCCQYVAATAATISPPQGEEGGERMVEVAMETVSLLLPDIICCCTVRNGQMNISASWTQTGK